MNLIEYEEKLRNSKIKFGLTTVKLNTLEPQEIYLEDMEEGTLHDYIVASSYLPIFKKEKLVDNNYYLDGGFYNLCPTDMLENIGCDKIYVVNIKGLGYKQKKKKLQTEIIEIKPYGNLGSIILFDKESNSRNILYGYYDTLKVLGKIDGIHYYFKKKSDRYYKKLNKKIDKKLLTSVETMLHTKDYKSTVLKALDYVLENNKIDDTYVYNVRDIIKKIKIKDKNNIIYKYVNDLKTK